MFSWIHSCPGRKARLQTTLDSCEASDLTDYELRVHPEGLQADEIETWWEEQLLDAAERSPYFLRLEDDVIVGRYLEHNIATWDALVRADFAVGSLFWLDSWPTPPDSELVPSVFKMTGPAQVWVSEYVKDIVEEMRVIRKEPGYRRIRYLDFDHIVLRAVLRLGLLAYQHTPSLVQCTPDNGQSMCGPPFRGFFARDFDPDWRR